ncbi:FixH family protein [Paracoccus marinaquae]|uniref:FixH family protein n=1 Tax=Paracoccus marinaquae TaxID=2841926 RepID=A0ABS6AJQ4_9RHOB|nr:FixH family protein [Paracoccus marinaquae]MBU3030818.1 FixH family protein [Paracoccus marinaquae]
MRRELTGRHVLAITLAAFGVIIAVNLVMAFMAVGTFPGLEVKNSYVASQGFDRERAAQDALGWTVTPNYDGRELTLSVTDDEGLPAPVESLAATIGRPTHERADLSPDFTFEGGLFRAPLVLEPGIWNIHVTATAPDGTEFRQRLDHYAGSVVK